MPYEIIPAHPLALTAERKLDERRQRALTRYYVASGVTGLAVGVHTTQFAIRESGLLEPVLRIAREEMGRSPLKAIAGVVGPTAQAVREAELAAKLGYNAVLLSLGALVNATTRKLIEHTEAVAGILPVVGFYLQPAVGGRVLPYDFWRRFVEIENVVAIKAAPFNRYQTLDVMRAVAESGRAIRMYTGNDDNIVPDLITEYRFGDRSVRFHGGLLGHWSVWTRKVVEIAQ
jgi:dihydrodipicolinate synthase/N-acetylneuraminate lyase